MESAVKLSGWGRHPVAECTTEDIRCESDLTEALAAEPAPMIARGNGRSYGDSAVQPSGTLQMLRLNRMLSFDHSTGIVVVEAGVLLGEIVDVFLRRGWFLPVTPGTKFASVGGSVAADVHGKNHHKHGSIGNFIEWIDLVTPDGQIRRLSETENPELFAWTIGGMGLTGVILRVALRLVPVETGWMRQVTYAAPNLATAMDLFESGADATYSVAWIDCLAKGDRAGRSLVMMAEHARLDELGPAQLRDRWVETRRTKHAIPFEFPGFALNSWSVKAFNAAYYLNGKMRAGSSLIDFDRYFYPLDALLEWNRIYGRRGFAQFQCVIPLEASESGLLALLRRIERSGQASFLAVLKRMGQQKSHFSFPMEGYTLALDFPMRSDTPSLFRELHRITIDHGGRFYLAKDSFLTANELREADPRSEAFVEMRKALSAEQRFASLQSKRLAI